MNYYITYHREVADIYKHIKKCHLVNYALGTYVNLGEICSGNSSFIGVTFTSNNFINSFVEKAQLGYLCYMSEEDICVLALKGFEFTMIDKEELDSSCIWDFN